jgi:hypothetical protein
MLSISQYRWTSLPFTFFLGSRVNYRAKIKSARFSVDENIQNRIEQCCAAHIVQIVVNNVIENCDTGLRILFTRLYKVLAVKLSNLNSQPFFSIINSREFLSNLLWESFPVTLQDTLRTCFSYDEIKVQVFNCYINTVLFI